MGWVWGTDLPLAAVVADLREIMMQEREAQSATPLNKATVPVRKLAMSSAPREKSRVSV